MRTTTVWVVIGLMAAAGVSQAMLPANPDELYPQNDGGSGGDASDVCGEPFPEVPRGEIVEGQLVPILDHDDVWAIPGQEGERLIIEVAPEPRGTHTASVSPALTVILWTLDGSECHQSLAEARATGGEPAQLEADLPATATYSLEVHLDGLSTDIDGQAPSLVVPASGHCSPVCLMDMDLLVTTG